MSDLHQVAMHLNMIGSLFYRRCKDCREWRQSEIDASIAIHDVSTSLLPNSDIDKAECLDAFASSLMLRFENTGQVADIDQAVSAAQQSVDLTPNDHASLDNRLQLLGIALWRRYKRLGRLDDLERAINAEERAVDITATDDVGRASHMNNLATSLTERFKHSGEIEDIKRAIYIQERALDLTPDGHASKPSRLMNLGTSLQSRFERSGEMSDIDKAIVVLQKALDLTPDGHADKPSRLMNLGNSLHRRFERSGEMSDIDKAIVVLQKALDLTLDGHANKAAFLNNLGGFYHTRFRTSLLNNDVLLALSAYQQASSSLSGPPSTRFRAARSWAKLSAQHSGNATSTLDAYAIMMSLVPRLAWLGNSIRQRFYDIQLISAAVTEAAAFACSSNRLDLALEWLEQGRSIVWGQTLHLRTPMDNLALDYPDLHQDLQNVARQLEQSSTSLQPQVGAEDLMSKESASIEEAAQQHRRLAERWEALLTQVRQYPEYADFLQPKRLASLVPASDHGTIVVINVGEERCDALILRESSSTVEHLYLSSASKGLIDFAHRVFSAIMGRKSGRDCEPQDAVNDPEELPDTDTTTLFSCLWSELHSERGTSIYHGPSNTIPQRYMKMVFVFGLLWVEIVKPVLNFLDIFEPTASGDRLPRITWCATGSLALLPIHAAGLYLDEDHYATEKLYRYAVSSYTPTLSALLHVSQNKSDHLRGLLAVSQPATPYLSPLPGTTDEVIKIKELMEQRHFNWLDHDRATVSNVLNHIEDYSWIHFACHGVQRQDEATQSAFALYDGHLTLERISRLSLKSAQFAFLSACQTATGADKLPDEAVHLGAGMLTAGYRSVVATLWSISDYHAPKVAEAVYKELLKNTKLEDGKVAYALHQAVGRLREEVGEKEFKAWVPFIHIGL